MNNKNNKKENRFRGQEMKGKGYVLRKVKGLGYQSQASFMESSKTPRKQLSSKFLFGAVCTWSLIRGISCM